MEEIKLYHYTSISHLIEIFRTGKLNISQTDKMLKVKKPGLWFSTNSEWEYSAFKRFNDGKKEFDLNKPEEFEKYIGCARFMTKLDSRFVTYAKYKYKSKAHPLVWEKMGEVGRSKGSNPDEWYATFSPLNIDNLDIEVYDNGKWYNLKKEDGEFDTELFNKNLEKTFIYKRGKELESKMEKPPTDKIDVEKPVVEEVKEEEPVVVEEVKEEEPVVVEEAEEQEPVVVEEAEEEEPVVVEEAEEQEPVVVEEAEEEEPVVEEVKEEEPVVVEEAEEQEPIVEEAEEEEPVVEEAEEQEPIVEEAEEEEPVVVEEAEEQEPIVEEAEEEEPVVEEAEEQEPIVEEAEEEEPVVEEVEEEEPVVEEAEEEEPVVEEVKEEEAVVEQAEEEEPIEEEVKPEGFMSKVRGFFGRFKKKDK